MDFGSGGENAVHVEQHRVKPSGVMGLCERFMATPSFVVKPAPSASKSGLVSAVGWL